MGGCDFALRGRCLIENISYHTGMNVCCTKCISSLFLSLCKEIIILYMSVLAEVSTQTQTATASLLCAKQRSTGTEPTSSLGLKHTWGQSPSPHPHSFMITHCTVLGTGRQRMAGEHNNRNWGSHGNHHRQNTRQIDSRYTVKQNSSANSPPTQLMFTSYCKNDIWAGGGHSNRLAHC